MKTFIFNTTPPYEYGIRLEIVNAENLEEAKTFLEGKIDEDEEIFILDTTSKGLVHDIIHYE